MFRSMSITVDGHLPGFFLDGRFNNIECSFSIVGTDNFDYVQDSCIENTSLANSLADVARQAVHIFDDNDIVNEENLSNNLEIHLILKANGAYNKSILPAGRAELSCHGDSNCNFAYDAIIVAESVVTDDESFLYLQIDLYGQGIDLERLMVDFLLADTDLITSEFNTLIDMNALSDGLFY